jgi:hypothetical protein
MRHPALDSLERAFGNLRDKIMVANGLMDQCPMCGVVYDPDEETHYVTERPIASGVQCIRISLPSR